MAVSSFSLCFRALKFGVSAHEKLAIVKADSDSAIVPALDNFADLIPQSLLSAQPRLSGMSFTRSPTFKALSN